MADSFQNEIPKARVNITLDVETNGARKKLELPLKMLVMGDYSNRKSDQKIADRERININKTNLDSVLKDMSPQVKYSVPNLISDDDSDLMVNLNIDSFKSFHPENVASQIPELHKLLAMRNLLKDLKSNLLDNTKFRKELESIVGNEPELNDLKRQLEALITADVDEATEQ
jgi:type VI secretion system protein ImpB